MGVECMWLLPRRTAISEAARVQAPFPRQFSPDVLCRSSCTHWCSSYHLNPTTSDIIRQHPTTLFHNPSITGICLAWLAWLYLTWVVWRCLETSRLSMRVCFLQVESELAKAGLASLKWGSIRFDCGHCYSWLLPNRSRTSYKYWFIKI